MGGSDSSQCWRLSFIPCPSGTLLSAKEDHTSVVLHDPAYEFMGSLRVCRVSGLQYVFLLGTDVSLTVYLYPEVDYISTFNRLVCARVGGVGGLLAHRLLNPHP